MKQNLQKYNFKNLKENDISNILNYYNKTDKFAIDIASQFKINKATLYKILKYNNVPTRQEIKETEEKINIKKIPKEVKAYLAGIVDGEGYIFIVFTKSTKNYLCGAYIRNTDKRVLDMFVKYFGCKINFRRRAKPNQKDSYTWTCFGLKAEKLCRSIFPYLIIKRKQAELLLEFSKTIKKSRKDNYKLSERIQKKRKVLIKKIKSLNKRGS